MLHDLVAAELKIKMNTHLTCTEFHDYLLTKPDLLQQFCQIIFSSVFSQS